MKPTLHAFQASLRDAVLDRRQRPASELAGYFQLSLWDNRDVDVVPALAKESDARPTDMLYILTQLI